MSFFIDLKVFCIQFYIVVNLVIELNNKSYKIWCYEICCN